MTNPKKKKLHSNRTAKLLVFIGRCLLAAVVISVLAVLCFRWIPPPTSAFMVKRHFENLFQKKQSVTVRYRWADWKSISAQMPLAVIASEDQKFPYHRGFDFEAISDAVENNFKGGRLRGASTITQQVAKNLFLWSGRSYVRKGLEAYFTVLLELLWPKKRILEIYLNIAEFGDGIYGVRAASETMLKKRPAGLTRQEAAIFAAVLPNPRKLKVRNPSPYVIERADWIENQMEHLGGTGYLRNL